MTSWDTRATQVLNLCQEARIKVPRQIAVLGVDNDELLDESCVPPLTSILPDHEKLGYAAARELATVRSPLEAIHVRRLEHACELLSATDSSVEAIANMCGYGSAVFLQKLFRRNLGVTPSEWRARNRR